MKRIITSVILVIFLLTLTTVYVYADEIESGDIQEKISNSIYLESSSPVYKYISTNSTVVFPNEIVIDVQSVMPLYQADIKDFISTQKLNIQADKVNNMQRYIGLANDLGGNYVGEVEFFCDGNNLEMASFTPAISKEFALDYKTNSEKINASISKKIKLDDIVSAKLVYFDGIGYTVIVSDGNTEVITTIGLQQSTSPLDAQTVPGAKSGDTIIETAVTVDELLAKAKASELKLSRVTPPVIPEGQNPPTGGIDYDNLPQSNNIVILLPILVITFSITIIFIVIIKKEQKTR